LCSTEFQSECCDKPFRSADVAKPIRALKSDSLAQELCAAPVKSAKRLVEIIVPEDDAKVA